MATAAERALARQIARLSRQVRQIQRGSQASLRSPVLSDGPVSYFDDQGIERFTVGPNDDGTVTASPINSTPPPVPTQPDVTPVEGGLEIVYDGTFVEESRPEDLAGVEVHVSEDPGFPATDETQVHAFTSEFGGNFFISAGPDAPIYTALVAVNLEGLESEKSEESEATALPFPEPEVEPDPPPEESPDITKVQGTPNSIVVITEPIRPGDKLKYYISTDPEFTPGPVFQVGPDTRSTVNVILTDADDNPLVEGQNYYFAVLAFNDEGPAPFPSPTVTGALDLTAVSEMIVATVYAGFALFGTLQVGQITIDANEGITIPTESGDITLPVDGTEAYIRAAITTTSLTAQGITNLQQVINLAGQMIVAAGNDRPSIPPTVEYIRPTVSATGSGAPNWNPTPLTMKGFTYDGTSWVNAFQFTSSGAQAIGVTFMDRTTRLVTQLPLPLPAGHTLVDLHGVAYVNGRYCFLVNSSVGGVFQRRIWTYTRAGAVWTLQSNFVVFNDGLIVPLRAAIGVDGTNILIVKAGVFGGTAWKYESWTTAGVANDSGNLGIPVGDRPDYVETDISGCFRGLADYGTSRIVVGTLGFDTVTFLDVAGTYTWQNGERWDRPATISIGPLWDTVESRFWHAGGDARLYPNSQVLTDFTVTGEYSWRDENATGGTHETLPSPPSAAIVWVKRLWLRFTASPAPGVGGAGTDKADRIAFYLKKSGAFQYRRVYLGTAGESTITTDNFAPPFNNTGTQPSATNTFDSITGLEGYLQSAKQVSSLPVWKLFGSGEGNVGPLKWDNAGVAVQDTLSVPAIGSFAGGLTLKRMGGVVYCIGGFTRAAGFNAAFIPATADLPVGWRPPVAITLPASLFFNSAANWQMTISTAGEVNIRQSAANATTMGIGSLAWPAT